MYEGKLIPKYDLCEKFGISAETFNYRTKKKGMSVEDALKEPKMCIGRPRKSTT